MRTESPARRSNADVAAKVPDLFRAFSDRNRLRILHVLRYGETCVGDLVTVLRIPQARVSPHLAYLRRYGLVGVRRHGLWLYYSLSPARSDVHRALLRCLSGCFGDLPDPAADAKRRGVLHAAAG